MAELFRTMDGNEAVADIAYRLHEVIAIFPITPSSPMGEWADTWATMQRPNLWGHVPTVVEMQSEGGAAGTVHGALQGGALTTTFTASQGLLLMLPNMYKIAGELTAAVFHVAARAVAAQALSIFCDHSDVMAARATGFALLASASVQEAMDYAVIAQAATLQARLPFLHFFDGFRTSHEIAKVTMISDAVLHAMIDADLIRAHRSRSLSPDRPVVRGTAQNPDVFFQARETVNPYYAACPEVTQQAMDRFARLTGRQYHLFEYYGAPDADYVIVLMGSGTETARETVDALQASGARVGLIKVGLYRPFASQRFVAALPATTKAVAVLDRTKEPGSAGEPLYLDCVTALYEAVQEGWRTTVPTVIGGRYGLGSKELTPAMLKGVFDELARPRPQRRFTLGIEDDVSQSSLAYDPGFSTESPEVVRAVFFGLGSDGTVGANKNTIKIIGEETEQYAQGYFVYDSKKAGSVTVSHLRFGPRPIHSAYLISQANLVACHQTIFLERYDMLQYLVPGGIFLLNTPYAPQEVWETLPQAVQEQLLARQARLYVIDAARVARDNGMGRHINTIMQVCFFAISNVLPRDEALTAITRSIRATYSKRGEDVVRQNLQAVEVTLAHLHAVPLPAQVSHARPALPVVSLQAPAFVQNVTARMIAGEGDRLPVSALPADGTYPSGTAQWEKRNLAEEIPVWDPQVCIECGKCAMVCPHSVIRIKVYEPHHLEHAPATFKWREARERAWQGQRYTIQVAPEDCTGCGICVDVCPAKNKSATRFKAINMQPQPPLREPERANWEFFLTLPEMDRRQVTVSHIRQQQVQQPLFEFSGACAGCGETPYLKLASQLFGDRMVVANATGCSSIYGGNLPTTPWTSDAVGRGPAWSNSLFEDNAEFGLGLRLAIDKQRDIAAALLRRCSGALGDTLVETLLTAPQRDEADIYEQRQRVQTLRAMLARLDTPEARQLHELADFFVKKSVWIIGGDGWGYDIGFGGLDHVLASGHDVNVLLLDTEVYSNTGGQMSKATPRAAVAKFAAGGKPVSKKDLGLMAMTYGTIYVASVAMGARDEHTLRAFLEAEAYQGPSLLIAYSHCIAHGIHMTTAMHNQRAAVDAGHWLLYRYHPQRAAQGENPLQLDSRAPKLPLARYLAMENRFNMLTKSHPEQARDLFRKAQEDVQRRWRLYEYLAAQPNVSQ